jgi:hypothetical protein
VDLEIDEALKEKLMYTQEGLRYKRYLQKRNQEPNDMMDIDKPPLSELYQKSVKDYMQKAIEDEFASTACFHGSALSQEKMDALMIDPDLICPFDSGLTSTNPPKVIFCGGALAVKIKVAQNGEDIHKYFVQAYISSKLNTDLFMQKYVLYYVLDNGLSLVYTV